jgi:glycosyltransferase involved in cell wall biosynthesis
MKAVLLANTAWYLYNFRISLAHALKERGWELVLVSPPDEYAKKLQEKGFTWRPISMTRRGFNPFVELSTINELVKLYREIQPDVVHHFTVKPVIYGSLAARRVRVPTIINAVTGLGYLFIDQGVRGKLLQKLIGYLYRISIRPSSVRVVFQNSDDQNVFLSSGWVRREQAVLIPGSGVDINTFSPLPEPESRNVVLMVGRMLWDKGVGVFVEAVRLLQGKGVDADFVLVGASDLGNPRAVPTSQLESWEQEGLIQWLGHQDDMPEIYARSMMVVLPTTYREGIPRTLIESAASGRPLIATDMPGCREVIQDGINGLLVPPNDPARLAGAIEKLLENSELRSSMGQAGRQMVIEKFSNQRIVEETLRLYPVSLSDKVAS